MDNNNFRQSGRPEAENESTKPFSKGRSGPAAAKAADEKGKHPRPAQIGGLGNPID